MQLKSSLRYYFIYQDDSLKPKMTKKNTYEAIVIGSGPTGLGCAKILADNGIKPLVIKKTEENSSQGFYSGLIFEKSLKGIFGKFWESKPQAPFERTLARQKSYLLDKESFTSIDSEPVSGNNFIVLRSNFSNWMEKQIEKSGGKILYETLAKSLIIEDDKVKGIKTDEEEFYSDIVIVSEGVKSILAKECGLRKGELTPEEIYLFVEEVIELPTKKIDERFEVGTGQGIRININPENFFGIPSTGYLQTNKKSVSICVGAPLKDLINQGLNINYCIEGLKIHPAIKDLIKGGSTIKYLSYILPQKIWDSSCNPERLYGNGYLLTGGCAMLVDYKNPDLSYLPFSSSKIAAETIIKAKKENNFSKQFLSDYQRSLVTFLKDQEKEANTKKLVTNSQ